MLDFGYYNTDCMDGMKEFPDKYFDLAIVDPPYGDGGVNGQAPNDSGNDLTGIGTISRGVARQAEVLQWHHFGGKQNWSDKYLLPEQAEHGRRNSTKKS